jgi:hypothetical protein
VPGTAARKKLKGLEIIGWPPLVTGALIEACIHSRMGCSASRLFFSIITIGPFPRTPRSAADW